MRSERMLFKITREEIHEKEESKGGRALKRTLKPRCIRKQI